MPAGLGDEETEELGLEEEEEHMISTPSSFSVADVVSCLLICCWRDVVVVVVETICLERMSLS